MTYIVLGCGLALLELWTIASQRAGGFYTLPQAIRLLMPMLIAVASFRRPRAERIPIVLFAIGSGLALNRDLTGNGAIPHVAVVACGLSAAWFGYNSPTPFPNERRRLLLTVLLVVLALLGLFGVLLTTRSTQGP
jgi:hypothetical protein